jgi:hypothetical protein
MSRFPPGSSSPDSQLPPQHFVSKHFRKPRSIIPSRFALDGCTYGCITFVIRNKGDATMSVLEKAQRIIDAGNNVATRSQSQIEGIQLFEGYAEPGYRDPKSGLIALGDWNRVTEYQGGKFVTLDDTPVRVAELLEHLGVDLGWSDEWMEKSAACVCEILI